MEAFMEEFQHLKIQLEDIKSATDDFDKSKVIGSGGFGIVYKGEVSHYMGQSMVAIKRLDRKFGQGDPEFWKEIMMLSRFKHENLISLLGFCTKKEEMILLYEYASNGSLDRHLGSTALTWTQRLKICLDAARGLAYLHDDKGTKQRVLHRDIKSSNILLDERWNAKVSDMGLSKIAPANQKHTAVMTHPVGTFGYCDPLYVTKGLLTKGADIYSFGVVLFEVLCGRLCYEGRNQILMPRWKEIYEQSKLQEIIFPDLKQQMDLASLETFSGIAYKCLQETGRPTMSQVVENLETALQYQKLYERLELPRDYKEIIETAATPLKYKSESELKMLLVKGILLNQDKMWFSLNMNGEHCEMISIAACLTPTSSESPHYICSSEYNSRFPVGCYEPLGQTFKAHVQTQFLSPRITYTVNLVFKNKKRNGRYIGLEYKLKGETTSYSFLADERDDGWLTAELYQFTSNQTSVDLKIKFDTQWCETLLIESIEFKPPEKVKHEAGEVDKQPISETETYWEQKLPNDYQDIIKRSKDGVLWTTKKELYYILCEGFLINDGDEWFSQTKDGKKCLMIPARAALEEDQWDWESQPGTRFEEVANCRLKSFTILCKFRSKMLSPQTTYATYLVYKLPQDKNIDQPPPVQVRDEYLDDSEEPCCIFLLTPLTPVIRWNRNIVDKKSYNPSNRPKIKGLPRKRTDGWMEVQVWEFQTSTSKKMITTRLRFSSYDMSLQGIIVQGLEFRPI